jgi:F0F1-type ATP synthase assembly protein I
VGLRKKRKRQFRQFGTMYYVSAVGIQFPVAIAIGFFFGRWLDRQLNTWPYLTGFFTFCGIAAGFVNLFKMTADAARAEAEEARRAAEESQENHDGER